MLNVEASRVIVTVASILITIGLYDQTLKIWRTKSAKDFTVTIVIALFVNELAWLNYGAAITEWPIVVVSLCNLPAAVMALIGYLKFRNPEVKNEH